MKMDKGYDKLTIILRDPNDQLVKMLYDIMSKANPGHSYEVVVDPDDSEYRKSFFIDGDGAFFIKKITKNKKEVDVKDDKLVEYLFAIQKD
jgi:hypothetical protein